jgi:uncharacterized membrane protein
MNYTNIVLVFAVIATALITGLYYAYSCSVNPGLGRLPDAQYITAMRSINIAIQNPVFFASFMGTLLLLPLSAYLSYRTGNNPQFILLLLASAFYIIGSFGVTAAGNVPLNNALDAFNPDTATPEAISNARQAFEARWNSLHTIRTWASLAALVLSVMACLSGAVRISGD